MLEARQVEGQLRLGNATHPVIMPGNSVLELEFVGSYCREILGANEKWIQLRQMQEG